MLGFEARMGRGRYSSLLFDQIMKGIRRIYGIIHYEMWGISYKISISGLTKKGCDDPREVRSPVHSIEDNEEKNGILATTEFKCKMGKQAK